MIRSSNSIRFRFVRMLRFFPRRTGMTVLPQSVMMITCLLNYRIEKWLSGRLGTGSEQVEVIVDREEITIMGHLTAQDTTMRWRWSAGSPASASRPRTTDRYRTRAGARNGQEGELGRALR